MQINKIVGTNETKRNIVRFPSPYWEFARTRTDVKTDQTDVIVFGNDIQSGIYAFGKNEDRYIAKFNECLAAIRKRYPNCNLYYKPHPADIETEQELLDLRGFRIINEKITAELFLIKHWDRIRAVFSIESLSSFSAYALGLNAYSFIRCFSGIYNPKFTGTVEDMYSDMPPSFFIKVPDQDIIDNAQILVEDVKWKQSVKALLDKNPGDIWLFSSFSEKIILLSILAGYIKELSPERRVVLIISDHRRWKFVGEDFIRENFDKIVVFPRIFYSLRPKKLWQAIQVARQVGRLKILSGDIIFVATQPDFVEDCLVSYHKKNTKIALLWNRDMYGQYDLGNVTYQNNTFNFNKATWFFNRIFEPLLGLHRSIYTEVSHSPGVYQNRYQEPLNDIFDTVHVFNVHS